MKAKWTTPNILDDEEGRGSRAEKALWLIIAGLISVLIWVHILWPSAKALAKLIFGTA